jgi:hypothetical protein
VVGEDPRSVYLAVGGAVRLDDPPGLVAERLEHLVVVAVLGELVSAAPAACCSPVPSTWASGRRPPRPAPLLSLHLHRRSPCLAARRAKPSRGR